MVRVVVVVVVVMTSMHNKLVVGFITVVNVTVDVYVLCSEV